jgi:hypothetical protein
MTRVSAPPTPKSPQTSSGISDRKRTPQLWYRQAGWGKVANRGATLSFARPIESSKAKVLLYADWL